MNRYRRRFVPVFCLLAAASALTVARARARHVEPVDAVDRSQGAAIIDRARLLLPAIGLAGRSLTLTAERDQLYNRGATAPAWTVQCTDPSCNDYACFTWRADTNELLHMSIDSRSGISGCSRHDQDGVQVAAGAAGLLNALSPPKTGAGWRLESAPSRTGVSWLTIWREGERFARVKVRASAGVSATVEFTHTRPAE